MKLLDWLFEKTEEQRESEEYAERRRQAWRLYREGKAEHPDTYFKPGGPDGRGHMCSPDCPCNID